ncbi:thiamine pyrophosphate-requiring protein [Sulfodiicoccus acidiphilus]|nr:thiamine pyrophosphate-requiring protein [Sulfodiicoccus acidiphilus]
MDQAKEREGLFPSSAADLLIYSLLDYGIEHVLMNTGTDYPSIIEAIAKVEHTNPGKLKALVVPHEMTAVSMAYGYYLSSSRVSPVMVHTIPGTANSICGLLNAQSMRIPILLIAGRTPVTESGLRGSRDQQIHWYQELRDQGELVRQFTKWDFECRLPSQVPHVLERAFELALSDPKGPVYITFPREVLMQEVPSREVRSVRPVPAAPTIPPISELEKLVDQLIGAENPLIVTSYLGRDAGAVGELVKFAEALSIPVVQDFYFLNFPTNNPLYVGSLESQYGKEYMRRSDVILLLDTDVPYIPSEVKVREDAKVLQLDVDPLKESIPMWGFKVDVALRGNCSVALPPLHSLALRRIDEGRVSKDVLRDRYARAKEAHVRMKEKFKEEALSHRSDRPIDPRWLSYSFGKVKDDSTIVFGEAVTSPVVEYMEFSKPGTVFNKTGFGCLGWAMGAALGAKLASPDKTVVALVGDGTYIYSAPTACHFVSRKYSLPFLTIVYNNQSWYASKRPVQKFYPEGYAVRTSNFPGVDLSPPPKFELTAMASDAFAEAVEDPELLPEALEKAFGIVKRGENQALLNVILKKP